MPTTKVSPTSGAVLLAPLLHLNGSSAQALLDGYRTAHTALYDALVAMRESAPHTRDYYPQGDDAFYQARCEHDARVAAVNNILAQYEMIIENVDEQADARLISRSR